MKSNQKGSWQIGVLKLPRKPKDESLANIRSKGTLNKWLDDKGFGFITPVKGKLEIFIHISAFDKTLPRRPKVGDTIFYYTLKDEQGETKAVEAIIEGVAPVSRTIPSKNRLYRRERGSKSRWRFTVLCTILVIGVSTTIYDRFLSNKGLRIPSLSKASNIFKTSQKQNQSLSRYTCAGKTRCNQMTSCEEATFYLQNCPGTKMDGDRDGIPCESQHCN